MLKVLIADDEQMICDMIIKMIDWSSKGLEVAGTASNGPDVLAKIEELTPDIVITDIRMPGKDGLQIITEVMKNEVHPDFIIISGFRYFEYAHQALTLGVKYYLLKPLERQELSDTLDRIVQERTIKNVTKNSIDDNDESAAEAEKERKAHLLKSVLNDIRYKTGEEESSDFDMNPEEGCFRSFFAKADWTEEGEIAPAVPEILKTLIDDVEKKWGYEAVTATVKNGIISIVNYPPEESGSFTSLLEKLYTVCRRETDKFEGYTVTFGVSTEKKDISTVRSTIGEAIDAVKLRIRSGVGTIIYYDPSEVKSIKVDDFFSPATRAGNRRAIASLDAEAVSADIRLLSDRIRGMRDYSALMLFDLIDAFNDLISETWKENDISEDIIREFRKDVDGVTDRSTTEARLIQQFEDTVVDYFRRLLALRRQTGQAPVRDAKEYLERHFTENPTLEEVADIVAISPAYLSTLFKRETGIGFSDYVIQLRCEEAKRLMRESGESVVVIAEKVGYHDARYFSRIFKKTVGLKPSEYRKLYQ